MQQWCKDDDESQWGRAKYDLRHPKPLNWPSLKFVQVIKSGIALQNFYQDRFRVSFPKMHYFAHRKLTRLFFLAWVFPIIYSQGNLENFDATYVRRRQGKLNCLWCNYISVQYHFSAVHGSLGLTCCNTTVTVTWENVLPVTGAHVTLCRVTGDVFSPEMRLATRVIGRQSRPTSRSATARLSWRRLSWRRPGWRWSSWWRCALNCCDRRHRWRARWPARHRWPARCRWPPAERRPSMRACRRRPCTPAAWSTRRTAQRHSAAAGGDDDRSRPVLRCSHWLPSSSVFTSVNDDDDDDDDDD